MKRTLCKSANLWKGLHLRPFISGTQYRKVHTSSKKVSANRRITSLDPLKITPGDWTDIRNLTRPSFRFGNRLDHRPILEYACFRQRGERLHVPWPESSARGFFYFRRPSTSTAHPAGGSLRFRSVESPEDVRRAFDFSSGFDSSAPTSRGFDIPLDAGGYTVPWSIPLMTLLRVASYSPIKTLLEDEGLISPQLSEDVNHLLQGYKGTFPKNSRVLDDITQPWILNLDLPEVRYTVLAEDKIHYVELELLTTPQTARMYVSKTQGVAMVRFELDDKQTLVLRILKFLVCPDPEVIAANLGQTEGKLLHQHLRVRFRNTGWEPPRIWSADPHRYLSPASVAALAEKYS
ncbi:hypothetical protein BKA70DRAFT_744528 [Coprinopsis sp. MPI-PUGE-AT-0042]|nr:hypothetical protein BKA70DRAFT_744528 [Coprinopsis sp. MPI-PUGE-AT-0042]